MCVCVCVPPPPPPLRSSATRRQRGGSPSRHWTMCPPPLTGRCWATTSEGLTPGRRGGSARTRRKTSEDAEATPANHNWFSPQLWIMTLYQYNYVRNNTFGQINFVYDNGGCLCTVYHFFFFPFPFPFFPFPFPFFPFFPFCCSLSSFFCL